MNLRPMFNAYPDSLGKRLDSAVKFLSAPEVKNTFESFYILPSIFNSDLDRGFSVIDYDLNRELAAPEDIENIKKNNVSLMMDFVLNHASVQSPQFQDILNNGNKSKYKDFFIDWNKFCEGCGEIGQDGYIIPEDKYIKNMFFRKKGLPVIVVECKDGTKIPYWNTFYQEKTENGYLGQMDLNLISPLVSDFYRQTIKKLASYGAKYIRLDAFAYACKKVGERNVFNPEDTWKLLGEINSMCQKRGIEVLPEIHAEYSEGIYKQMAEKGYLFYDFFMPGLILYSIEKHDCSLLTKWANEIIENNYKTVSMLGCHDGIPLLDLKGLVPEEEIQQLTETILSRGGIIKNLYGQKNVYYQVNSTYYSALGADDKKMLFARALQIFMPGKPLVWYLDLFAGKNNLERAEKLGHKEINRSNLSMEEVTEDLKKPVVAKQLELLKLRNNNPAFDLNSKVDVQGHGSKLTIAWKGKKNSVKFTADFNDYSYSYEEMS